MNNLIVPGQGEFDQWHPVLETGKSPTFFYSVRATREKSLVFLPILIPVQWVPTFTVHRKFLITRIHRLNVALDLQNYLGSMCTAVPIRWDAATLPPPPHLGSYTYEGAIGQPRVGDISLWPHARIRAGIFKESMGARNRVIVPARQATQAGGIHSLESILGLHKRLKILALNAVCVEGYRIWRGRVLEEMLGPLTLLLKLKQDAGQLGKYILLTR